jgi:hypothetical protein
MKPQQRILFIINVVLRMICIIPVTSQYHIHHSTLSEENSYSTNRGECCEQTNMKISLLRQGFEDETDYVKKVKKTIVTGSTNKS